MQHAVDRADEQVWPPESVASMVPPSLGPRWVRRLRAQRVEWSVIAQCLDMGEQEARSRFGPD